MDNAQLQTLINGTAEFEAQALKIHDFMQKYAHGIRMAFSQYDSFLNSLLLKGLMKDPKVLEGTNPMQVLEDARGLIALVTYKAENANGAIDVYVNKQLKEFVYLAERATSRSSSTFFQK